MKKDSTRIAVADISILKLKNEGADVMLYIIDEILFFQAVFINSIVFLFLYPECFSSVYLLCTWLSNAPLGDFF